jgi:diguanylate cyclase (GGDEF)-like protein
MQPPAQTIPVLSFLGVIVQLGGAVMLIGLFLMMRRFVLRRAYFTAWVAAWASLAVAILALVVRYILVPGISGTTLDDRHPVVRVLYLAYQMSKGLGLVFFLRGTLMYVNGAVAGVRATRRLWIGVAALAALSTFGSRHGLNEMVIWQAAIASPLLCLCAATFLRLPRARRTPGSLATGTSFALLAVLWVAYGAAFGLVVSGIPGRVHDYARALVSFNSYFDLTCNVLLGYAMILLLLEDAKRELDAAQSELRMTHDQLKRAALVDSLTETLNRRAYSEGVGLDIVRASFGTVVMADLDNLKVVNDKYGHSAGDKLIRLCADVLRETQRAYDKLYRWGGDEFLLILPTAHASDILARLQRNLDNADPVLAGPDAEPAYLRVSLGAADYSSYDELSEAIQRADRAMYKEKNRRRLAAGEIPGERGTPQTPSLAIR